MVIVAQPLSKEKYTYLVSYYLMICFLYPFEFYVDLYTSGCNNANVSDKVFSFTFYVNDK